MMTLLIRVRICSAGTKKFSRGYSIQSRTFAPSLTEYHAVTFDPTATFCVKSSRVVTVTSLPSPYGIGDLGPAAFAWVDHLHNAGQSWWQALPLGPTGYGNSPYQSLSSFAGNGLLISPDALIEDELLRASDVAGHSFPATA